MADFVITKLIWELAGQSLVYSLGEDTDLGRIVKIAYQDNPHHRVYGSAYQACYTVEYAGSTVRTIIPYHAMRAVITDVVPGHAKDDGAKVPELPGAAA